ncbi:MAG TPA: transcription initiation factor IIB [Candidatus Poseidoniales archaeon]|nr:MAG: transcription initiation factor IIB [Euryarchaeota archaeon]HIA39994.1 transcription initiation factor IIB [Candidatus Poseidoniales archaeon]PXY76765.1 MAG: transcription initiation factor IIB [Euryarchaeota archaeon]HIA90600.1 transcription initiation factor IIB [Candidatus Poseidoniales archaeon]HIB59053.1 transcription initiation factor IIB [Candidatus Poseidoniales archaeon]
MSEHQNEKTHQKAPETNSSSRSGTSPRASPHPFGGSRPSQQRKTTGMAEPCSECGSISWDEDLDRGEIVCGECGLVVDENLIDPGAEWSNHDGKDNSRVGSPITPTLSDKGLNTTISRSDLYGGAAARHGMNARARRDWNRRRVIDDRSKTRKSRDRNLAKAMSLLRSYGDLPGTLLDEAAVFYRKAVEAGVVTGRSIAGIAGACAYLAARERSLPRSIEEVADSFQVEYKEMKRNIRLVSRIIGAHTISDPGEYIDKFCSQLGLHPSVVGEAHYLWERVKIADEWQGKKPSGVAGVMIYKAAQIRGNTRTQADVCEVAGISEVTLRGLLRILDGLMKYIGEATEN